MELASKLPDEQAKALMNMPHIIEARKELKKLNKEFLIKLERINKKE